MAKDRKNTGAQHAIVPADKRQLQRQPDAEVKVPGYFGAWAKRFRWKEYAIAWDAYFNDITATRRDDQMAAARRETVEQAEQLQTLIKQEIGYAIQPRALLAIDLQRLRTLAILRPIAP